MVKEAKAKVKVIVKVEATDKAKTNAYIQTKLNYCQTIVKAKAPDHIIAKPNL
jgi:hypothetical protein